jgi:hypothetical protein
MNCGSCGNICNLPHATAGCVSGNCTIAVCDAGWTDCNGMLTDGCEANLQNDPNNCGQCGTQCTGQMMYCTMGACTCGCPKGFDTCPGAPPCSCATMLGTNENCNFCGDTCALQNALSQCQPSAMPPPDFVCALVQCAAGYADCDMNPANGCEVDTTTVANTCGSCGMACAAGHACAAGMCQ